MEALIPQMDSLMCSIADCEELTLSMKAIGAGQILFQYSIEAMPSTRQITGSMNRDLYFQELCSSVSSFSSGPWYCYSYFSSSLAVLICPEVIIGEALEFQASILQTLLASTSNSVNFSTISSSTNTLLTLLNRLPPAEKQASATFSATRASFSGGVSFMTQAESDDMSRNSLSANISLFCAMKWQKELPASMSPLKLTNPMSFFCTRCYSPSAQLLMGQYTRGYSGWVRSHRLWIFLATGSPQRWGLQISLLPATPQDTRYLTQLRDTILQSQTTSILPNALKLQTPFLFCMVPGYSSAKSCFRVAKLASIYSVAIYLCLPVLACVKLINYYLLFWYQATKSASLSFLC